jgi:hypothetical protein
LDIQELENKIRLNTKFNDLFTFFFHLVTVVDKTDTKPINFDRMFPENWERPPSDFNSAYALAHPNGPDQFSQTLLIPKEEPVEHNETLAFSLNDSDEQNDRDSLSRALADAIVCVDANVDEQPALPYLAENVEHQPLLLVPKLEKLDVEEEQG